jgi:hypothetical protein
MGEFAEDDEEDDEGWDPRPHFVVVDYLVAEDRYKPGCCCYDDDACITRDGRVDGVDELGADYDVDGGPAYTGEDVEARNWGSLALISSRMGKTAGFEGGSCIIGWGSM